MRWIILHRILKNRCFANMDILHPFKEAKNSKKDLKVTIIMPKVQMSRISKFCPVSKVHQLNEYWLKMDNFLLRLVRFLTYDSKKKGLKTNKKAIWKPISQLLSVKKSVYLYQYLISAGNLNMPSIKLNQQNGFFLKSEWLCTICLQYFDSCFSWEKKNCGHPIAAATW